jgi:hypothetical protein
MLGVPSDRGGPLRAGARSGPLARDARPTLNRLAAERKNATHSGPFWSGSAAPSSCTVRYALIGVGSVLLILATVLILQQPGLPSRPQRAPMPMTRHRHSGVRRAGSAALPHPWGVIRIRWKRCLLDLPVRSLDRAVAEVVGAIGAVTPGLRADASVRVRDASDDGRVPAPAEASQLQPRPGVGEAADRNPWLVTQALGHVQTGSNGPGR